MNWRQFIGTDVPPAFVSDQLASGQLVSDGRGVWVEPPTDAAPALARLSSEHATQRARAKTSEAYDDVPVCPIETADVGTE